jgi:hypothetical protein|tara:strand:- start:480 stop:698 length:219 start_codon:yes stop_codon:yes gene_type:complete
MSTSSKKKTQKKNDNIGHNDNNVAKVNTTSYASMRNMPESHGYHKKKKKKPTVYAMTSKDIINKTKKKYGGA